MGDRRCEYLILVWKPKGKRSFGIARYEREDNIKMDLQGVGWSMDWNDLAHDGGRWRDLVNMEMNPRFSQNVERFLTISKPVSFSRKSLFHGVCSTVGFVLILNYFLQIVHFSCTFWYKTDSEMLTVASMDNRIATFRSALSSSVKIP
jgi:hypothetical protein